MARFCPLFSSSSGNCTYIGTGRGGILIDAGASAKRIEQALCDREIDPRTIEALFITHEHSDHIGGVRVFAARYGIPVYASAGTLRGMERAGACDRVDVREMTEGADIAVADMSVTAFPTPHDTVGSTGYIVTAADGRTLAVATDMGTVTDRVRQVLCGCDAVLIESNYDRHMLDVGPYPYPLKQRIAADTGHLCNDDCAAVLPTLVQSGVSHLFLGHLSPHNNLPALAEQTAQNALDAAGLRPEVDYRLRVAERVSTAPVVYI
ncbi:MAG: MBL fold metallo-hydrolase [Clostridia bacterium]|nr:MBL fold metallo-hydrolase [Clostridia bacterium]